MATEYLSLNKNPETGGEVYAEFVGRKAEIKAFSNLLTAQQNWCREKPTANDYPGTHYSVLNYYGFTGMGTTALVREMRNIAQGQEIFWKEIPDDPDQRPEELFRLPSGSVRPIVFDISRPVQAVEQRGEWPWVEFIDTLKMATGTPGVTIVATSLHELTFPDSFSIRNHKFSRRLGPLSFEETAVWLGHDTAEKSFPFTGGWPAGNKVCQQLRENIPCPTEENIARAVIAELGRRLKPSLDEIGLLMKVDPSGRLPREDAEEFFAYAPARADGLMSCFRLSRPEDQRKFFELIPPLGKILLAAERFLGGKEAVAEQLSSSAVLE